MSRHRKLTTICAAVVLSLGLAACGGGGGGSPQISDNNNAANEAKALADAQKAAMTAAGLAATAATDARQKATDARAAANTLKELAPNTGSATEADTAATNAEKAATDAETARDDAATADTNAQAAKTSSVAKGHQADAEKAQKTAQGALETAADEYKTAMSALNAVEGPMITAARNDASKAAKDAKDAYDEAKQSAEDAREKATDARSAANHAMAARTGYADADAQATAAETAATNAEAARDKAKTASDNAAAASTAANDATTAKDARAQADIAEDERDEAVEQQGTAATEYDTANTAAGNATTASSSHVMRLFKDANADDVTDNPDTDTNEKTAEILSIGAAIAAAASASNGNQRGNNTTATASWPGDTSDNPDTADTDETAPGNFSLAVAPGGGTALPFELRATRAATDLNNDGDTTDEGEAAITQTAKAIDGLGVFKGYEIWEAADTTASTIEGSRVIAFTDKVKGKDATWTVAAVAARSVVGHAIPTADAGQLAKVTSTATTITGVEWTPSGDTVPLKGTLSCETGCSITLSNTEEGKVTAIAGYKFTGSRAEVKGVEQADAAEDTSYLLFGLWMNEADNGNDSFGSFANGGAAVTNVADTIKGTATYKGKAAGVKSTAAAADFFSADATLDADFGTEAEAGTISGRIHNIVAGGVAESGVIHLHEATLNGAFNGTTRMGTGKVNAGGTTIYPFNGTWSGQFYNTPVNDPDTTADESTTVAPGSVAGTFGVTMADDADTKDVNERTSYVGAFGAHNIKQ